eukprot:4096537-Prymnesium_polylepis.1
MDGSPCPSAPSCPADSPTVPKRADGAGPLSSAASAPSRPRFSLTARCRAHDPPLPALTPALRPT